MPVAGKSKEVLVKEKWLKNICHAASLIRFTVQHS